MVYHNTKYIITSATSAYKVTAYLQDANLQL